MISVRDFEKTDRQQIDMNEDFDPTIDPDNPPLTGKEVMMPGPERFLASYARIAAQIAARKKAEQAASQPPTEDAAQ
jgi:hypothetical protein